MVLRQGLRVSPTQRLALTPGLRQSIGILKMSATELSELIATELDENPLLTLETDPAPSIGGDHQFALDTVAHEQTLAETLSYQISVATADDDVRNLAIYLANDLTSEGYLADSDADIAETLTCDIDLVKRAISLLQTCEPVGIGARNLRECLNLQLLAASETDENRAFIIENMTRFAKPAIAALARKSGRREAELHRMAASLHMLNPHPGARHGRDAVQPLRPDINVTALHGAGFSVEMVNSVAPSLFVDKSLYDRTVKGDPGSLVYMQTQASGAASLINAIQSRSKTVLRVAREIVALQHQFFSSGHNHLQPLTQSTLAQALGFHPSTVNRAIANKALACSFGVFPLRFFFSGAIGSLTTSDASSAYSVQQEIRKLIGAEPPTNVLSDARIATLLRQSGVDIARRTVAKYRQCLKISSSVQRRRSKQGL